MKISPILIAGACALTFVAVAEATPTSIALALLGPAGRIQANPYSLGLATSTIPTGPKLIVLIHGATPKPTEAVAKSVPEPNSGTLDFTCFYFSESFVKQLLGGPSTIKTLGGVNVTGVQWNLHGTPTETKHKVTYTQGCDENQLNDHLIVRGDHTGAATPMVSVLLTYRDGSLGLMTQTKTIIDQVYSKYTQLFGSVAQPIAGKVPPSIIFVVHSMGGPVARTILSAPSDPIQQISLTSAQRQKAMAIRDKTISLVTLASPHEGSPLADRATNLANWLQNDGKTAIDLYTLPLPDAVKRAANDARLEKIESLNRDALRDLGRGFWTQMNTGVLAPHRAKRSDDSLVPIYTLIGHSPGGAYFKNPDTQWPLGGISLSDSSNEETRRNSMRSLGLMMADYALHNVPTQSSFKEWGATSRDEFDLVARYHRNGFGLTLSPPGDDPGIPLGIPKFFNRDHVTEQVKDIFGKVTGTRVVRTNKDGELDADGLVDVASGHGFRLGTNTNYYFDHGATYTVGGVATRGSWYRILPPEDWKYANHETIHRLATVGNWIYLNIVGQAGPLTSAGELSVWPRFRLRDSGILSPVIQPKLKKTTVIDPP